MSSNNIAVLAASPVTLARSLEASRAFLQVLRAQDPSLRGVVIVDAEDERFAAVGDFMTLTRVRKSG